MLPGQLKTWFDVVASCARVNTKTPNLPGRLIYLDAASFVVNTDHRGHWTGPQKFLCDAGTQSALDMRTEPTVQDEFLRMPTLQRKKHGGQNPSFTECAH